MYRGKERESTKEGNAETIDFYGDAMRKPARERRGVKFHRAFTCAYHMGGKKRQPRSASGSGNGSGGRGPGNGRLIGPGAGKTAKVAFNHSLTQLLIWRS